MMPIKLSELLDPRSVELELSERKKPDILREMVQVLARGNGIPDPDGLYESLLERESMGTTGIGNGIAIPHAMVPGLETTRIAFARKLEGAKFDSVDNQPVSLFFLLAGPEGDPGLHLKVLSKLARYLHDGAFCDALLQARTPEEVIEAFRVKDGP
ncbi:MAG TPA: PTS sugar transporter subunit IIA [Candidatus Sabulitectum sp.]|nr:PTS sugar transporter subunit IIA [Candidatus Sabulitectum sp.]HPR22586.1 PTS sugar transporter subunit IIA [Candidatus Sabulitectum sp.]